MESFDNKNNKNSEKKDEQLENVVEKYINAEGYIRKNEENMNQEQLENMERKQENREIQIENLEDE